MNYWWIDEGKAAGSRNPSMEQLQTLYSEGFRTIISLLDERYQQLRYSSIAAVQMGYQIHCIPMEDFSAPSMEQLQSFVDKVEAALKEGKVLIHCEGGSGRTGTMAAAYWVWKGLSADRAIRKVRAANPYAVETREQKQSLYQFERYLKDR